jgi:hypothetical protein
MLGINSISDGEYKSDSSICDIGPAGGSKGELSTRKCLCAGEMELAVDAGVSQG